MSKLIPGSYPLQFGGEAKTDLMKIQVTVKHVYGRPLIYIQSFQLGPIQKLTGRSTLTPSDIDALKTLGYAFEEVLPAGSRPF